MSESEQKVFGDYQKPPDQIWTIPSDDDRGVYRFILAAARRARRLQQGARPRISTTSRKSTKIAMEEVRSGAVQVEIVPEDQPWSPQPVEPARADEADPFGPLPRSAVFMPDK